jgi:hypothetical protein
MVFVADRRSEAWTPGHLAVYARVPSLDTPMGSHLAAYANEESRSSDLGKAEHEKLSAPDVFGTTLERAER